MKDEDEFFEDTEPGPAAEAWQQLRKDAEALQQGDIDEAERVLIRERHARATGPTLIERLDAMEEKGEIDLEKAAKLVREYEARHRVPQVQVHDDWTGEPVARDWLIPGWLQRGQCVLLTGSGGRGKSLFALQLAAAVASQHPPPRGGPGKRRAVLPSTSQARHNESIRVRFREHKDESGRVSYPPEPVLFFTWEDDPDEVLRRLSWFPRTETGQEVRTGLDDRLKVVNLAGQGPLFGPDEGIHLATRANATLLGLEIARLARKLSPALIVLDPLAAAYLGNENDRSAVRLFSSHWNHLAASLGAAVVIIAHPPKTGGDYSGSTDWHAGFRSLWTLSPQPTRDLEYKTKDAKGKKQTKQAKGLALERAKANYAADGEKLWLKRVATGFDNNGTEGENPRLHWERCTVRESAEVLHALLGLPKPVRKKAKTEDEPLLS